LEKLVWLWVVLNPRAREEVVRDRDDMVMPLPTIVLENSGLLELTVLM
jgi:hypothetical protein